MFGSLKEEIDRIFSESELPCLWFSGGDDSRLLLEAMLETGKPFIKLRFDHGWNRTQRRYVDSVINGHGIQAFSYPPTSSMFIARRGRVALVSSYSVNAIGDAAYVLRDIVEGDGCVFDVQFPQPVIRSAPIECDLHVWGTRRQDRHWSIGKAGPFHGWTRGGKRFVAPLMKLEMTAADVRHELKKRGIEPAPVDTGDIAACSACLTAKGPVYCPKANKEIPAHKWDPKVNLDRFLVTIGRK